MYDELVKNLREKAEFLASSEPLHIKNAFAETMKQAADAIEELSAIRDEQKAQIILMAAEIEEQQPCWISVNERMPEPGVPVLAVADWGDEPGVLYGIRWNGTEWEVELEAEYDYWERYTGKITHWMPIPEPPKEETHGN